MITKPELIKKVKDYFNLNIYETKVWLALVSKGIASAGEIAEMSGVPRSRTYDVLESLEKEGFAIAKVGKPSKYIAVKPTQVLEKLKHSVMHKADERLKTLEGLKGTKEYSELEALHNSALAQIKTEDVSGALKGKSNIFGHVRELLENAEKEVIIAMPAHEFLERAKLFSGMFERLKKANISVKAILNGTNEQIKKASEIFSIKVHKTDLQIKMFVIDRKQALFYLTNQGNDDDLAVWLNSDFFSSTLAQLLQGVK